MDLARQLQAKALVFFALQSRLERGWGEKLDLNGGKMASAHFQGLPPESAF